jgi:hypothetical protein
MTVSRLRKHQRIIGAELATARPTRSIERRLVRRFQTVQITRADIGMPIPADMKMTDLFIAITLLHSFDTA